MERLADAGVLKEWGRKLTKFLLGTLCIFLDSKSQDRLSRLKRDDSRRRDLWRVLREVTMVKNGSEN